MIRRKRFQAKPIVSSQTKKAAEDNIQKTAQLFESENNSQIISPCSEINPIFLAPTVEHLNTLPLTKVQDESKQNNFLTSEKTQNFFEENFQPLQSVLSSTLSNSSLSKPTLLSINYDLNSVDIIVNEETEVDIDKIDESILDSSIIMLDVNENNFDEKKSVKRKRKSVRRDEDLDTKKFTLADLIDWRPKTENTLRKKWDEKRQKILENVSNSSTSSTNEKSEETIKTNETKSTGPRVKINENGEMVIDEESLIVTNVVDVNLWETVNDDLMPKKLNSMSFRRRVYKRSVNWSILETDLFYEVLSATGIDFGLMHEFISSRTRYEIKKKFQREEKLNDFRIKETLDNPTILDETLYTRIDRLKKKIERELEEKIIAKQKTVKASRGRPRKLCPLIHNEE